MGAEKDPRRAQCIVISPHIPSSWMPHTRHLSRLTFPAQLPLCRDERLRAGYMEDRGQGVHAENNREGVGSLVRDWQMQENQQATCAVRPRTNLMRWIATTHEFIWDGRRKPTALRPSGGVDGGVSPGIGPLFSGMEVLWRPCLEGTVRGFDDDQA